MKAIIVQDKAGTLIVNQSQPRLRDDYVLVKTVAVALNPTDWKHASFGIANDGNLLGCDFSGIVEEVGPAVSKTFQKGDAVMGVAHGGNPEQPRDGAFAEYVVAKGDTLMKKPTSLTFEKAATVSLGAITCGQGLFQKSLKLQLPDDPIRVKTYVLIYGGSTATGALAIQFATLAGYSVLTLCSKKHFKPVKDLGAVEVYNYSDPDVGSAIRKDTQNSLKYAWDTFGKAESSQICADALSTEAGCIYGCVLPNKCPRSDVTSVSTVMYTMFGEYFTMRGIEFPAMPDDYDFAKKFMTLTEKLLAEGALKTHSEIIKPNGFEGVLEGLKDLKEGKVSGKKLVIESPRHHR
ncbi:toxd [Hyphodiscus hymeniophilus]|uniref:Toxd n=1 Tax=Hyphodiscus hymeniophilus TaxID=353542 RepID=A0A9P7AWG5_9HELO|nr:toxd [Hyphodiscus hymeniophilus]